MSPAIILVIGESLRLVNNLIEGTDVRQRQAQSRMMFWLTWPLGKQILEAAGMTEEQLAEIEKMVGKN